METSNESRRSLCIFCLKTIDDSTNDFTTNTKRDRLRFFTLIIRHFLSYSYSTLVGEGNQEWFEKACTVFSEISTISGDDHVSFFENVQICGNCDGITRKFTDLYQQLKELEYRIDWEVGKLWGVMGGADKVVSKVEKEELEKQRAFDGGRSTLGELRNIIQQGCQVYQETMKEIPITVSKVELPMDCQLNRIKKDIDLQTDSEQLSPINFEEPKILPMEVPEDFTQSESDNPGNFFPEELVDENDGQKMSVDVPVHPAVFECENNFSSLEMQPFPAPTVLQEEDPLNPPNKSGSTYICTTCSLPFTSKFELFQHNMANHIEKYFLSVQPSSISNDQFKNWITSLLETTLDTFENTDEEYKCPLCFDKFSGMQKARNHLVVKHRSTLKEKLVERQKSESDPLPTPQELSIDTTNETTSTTSTRKGRWNKGKKRKSIPKSRKSDFKCSRCSLFFPDKGHLFAHDMNNHPEKYFVSVKVKVLTPHQFQNCVAHILTTSVDEFQKVDSKYQCNLCGILLSQRRTSRNHLVAKHRSNVKEKLVELQNSSDINLIMHTSRRSNNNFLNVRSIEACSQFCNICEKEFKLVALLNRHQSYWHPEIFFESSNILPPSSKNKELFEAYVHYVMEEQMQVPVPKTGEQVKCGICCYISSCRESAKSHLILRHQVFLADKLESVQKTGKSLHEVQEEMLKLKAMKRLKKQRSQATASGFHASLVEQQNSGNVPLGHSITGDTSSKRRKIEYESSNRSPCNICGRTYKNGYVLHRHKNLYHPETFFETEKPSALKLESGGSELFSKYVRYILEKQVDQEFLKIPVSILQKKGLEKQPQASTSRDGADIFKYKCNFCSQTVCYRKFAITHLISRHRTNMAEKLAGLNGKSVEEIKLEMIRCGGESSGNCD